MRAAFDLDHLPVSFEASERDTQGAIREDASRDDKKDQEEEDDRERADEFCAAASADGLAGYGFLR